MQGFFNNYWLGSGLTKGDTVLLHSSMRRLIKFLMDSDVSEPPKIILDSLLEFIGNKGTLVLPLFNFDFTKNQFYSAISTPSQMGAITEYARLNYAGVQTGHPVYPFYAVGHNQKEFANVNNVSAYGIDSPFAKIVELEGKIAAVDLPDSGCMTFYHYIEEMCQVPYRYYKDFSGSYQDIDGAIELRTYKIYVRDLDAGVITNVDRMGEILWNEHLYSGNRPGIGHGMRTIDANAMFLRTQKEILEGRAIETLYSIKTIE
jgi:aminoglycoside 3-N-acetyltransferase